MELKIKHGMPCNYCKEIIEYKSIPTNLYWSSIAKYSQNVTNAPVDGQPVMCPMCNKTTPFQNTRLVWVEVVEDE